MLADMNRRLAKARKKFRVSHAEFVTTGTGGQAGRTLFANNRVKQLGSHWVPGDPRRGGGINLTYLVDRSDGATSTLLQSLHRQSRRHDRPRRQ